MLIFLSLLFIFGISIYLFYKMITMFKLENKNKKDNRIWFDMDMDG